MNKLLEEQAKLQDAIDAKGGWELERKLEVAADALRLPPWDADVDENLRRRAPPRRAVPPAAVAAGHAAAGRAHQPPRRRIGRVAGALPRELSRHGDRGHARSLLPRQRRRLDPGAGPRPRHSVGGQLLLVAGAEGDGGSRSRRSSRKACARRCERELEWVRSNPKARQAKSKARVQRYEELASQEFQKRNETNEIYIPPGARLGELVIEAKGLKKGLRRAPAVRQPQLQPAGGRHRRRHRPERRRQDHPVPHHHRPGKPDSGEVRIGPSVQLAYVDQSRQSLERCEHRLAGNLRRPRHDPRRQLRDLLARLRRAFQFPRHAAAAADRRTVGWRAQPRAPGESAEERRQRDAARRADQRPGRRNAARTGRSAAELPGLRRRDLARPLVPGPHRDAHPRVRGQQRSRSGSRATTRNTSRTTSGARAKTRTARTASASRSSRPESG